MEATTTCYPAPTCYCPPPPVIRGGKNVAVARNCDTLVLNSSGVSNAPGGQTDAEWVGDRGSTTGNSNNYVVKRLRVRSPLVVDATDKNFVLLTFISSRGSAEITTGGMTGAVTWTQTGSMVQVNVEFSIVTTAGSIQLSQASSPPPPIENPFVTIGGHPYTFAATSLTLHPKTATNELNGAYAFTVTYVTR